METLFHAVGHARGMQRVLLFTIGIIPMVLVTVSALPAVLVLPFLGSSGLQRAEGLLRQLVSWTRVLLHGTKSGQADG
jgi:hypothetical protein